jgi:hypothetical protein
LGVDIEHAPVDAGTKQGQAENPDENSEQALRQRIQGPGVAAVRYGDPTSIDLR